MVETGKLKSYGLTTETDEETVNNLKNKFRKSVESGPISNEFAGAALRIGHSNIEGFIK